MSKEKDRKLEYLRKLDIRVKKWVRSNFQSLSKAETDKMIKALVEEGERLYDEVNFILNVEE
jgi:hypothetical protein